MSTRALVDSQAVELRHVYPDADGTVTVLGATYAAAWLPSSSLPTSPDLVEGSYTGRLDDAGEFSLSFPNAPASDGQLWRERFDPDGAREFVEIYEGGRDAEHLRFVGCVQRMEIDRGTVTISGPDAWTLLRRAYERDRTWTAAPRDVIAAYTRVPVPVVADDFPGSSLDAAWTSSGTNTTRTVSGGWFRSTGNGSASQSATIYRTVAIDEVAWRATLVVANFGGGSAAVILEDALATTSISLTLTSTRATLTMDEPSFTSTADIPFSPRPEPCTLVIERRGPWVFGFANGTLVGVVAPPATPVTFTKFSATANPQSSTTNTTALESVSLIAYQDLLQRGSDQGDYVLPGDYPTGGLRGRYFDDADMQSDADRRYLTRMSPARESYAERLDATVATASISIPVQPGNSGDYFSVRWFGAVYLRLDLGNYTFELTSVDHGARLFVGKTQVGDEIVDAWTASGSPAGTTTGTLTAADLGSEAGWYPIVLDYFALTATPAITLKFTPPGTGYTDPGGTSIVASTKITIPATSLSPLGCYDGRIQGQAHFDVIQSAAAQFGYQLRCEPMSLESGEFPGRLVPRARVGRDTDVVLEVDDSDRADPVISPGVTYDASDQTLSLIGSGAGLADGAGSQVTAEITDLAAVDSGLFALEGVVDSGEIGFPDLLRARLDAELALRSSAWQEVRGTPLAQDRLADTWPLSRTLSAMRWEPGDGIRLSVPDIGVTDLEPRQLLQVTRSFVSLGRTGTQVAFRQRPRSAARSIRTALRASLAGQRSYQGQKVTLQGGYVSASQSAGAYGGYSIVALLPSDRVVSASLRIVQNSAAQSLEVEINSTDRTTVLGGPWSTVPLAIDIGGYATQASTTDNRLFARVKNAGGSSTVVDYVLVVEVLR